MSPASAHPATSESPEATKKEVSWATPAEKVVLKLAGGGGVAGDLAAAKADVEDGVVEGGRVVVDGGEDAGVGEGLAGGGKEEVDGGSGGGADDAIDVDDGLDLEGVGGSALSVAGGAGIGEAGDDGGGGLDGWERGEALVGGDVRRVMREAPTMATLWPEPVVLAE